eukprot:CAMPEP_0201592868 /NCGR_PEP_ID=MMETSP0190_2-20130828/190637_1 /ASSEMBLY_ACC=CAM_ASM_000263 /TAXON_ID=37353 /ORGANISM="Rosalina sp." /LENGTH=180 /DNA_ID=CAMNT_0048051817 /DNA_START=46 /DNA_END=588 /DNA_ORIENTATION=+
MACYSTDKKQKIGDYSFNEEDYIFVNQPLDEEGPFNFTTGTKSPFDDEEDESSDDDEYEIRIDSNIEFQLRRTIFRWMQKKRRCFIDVEKVKKVFFIFDIDFVYFSTHSRKDFMSLLKRELDIPCGASTKIWNDFKRYKPIIINDNEVQSDFMDEYRTEFERDPFAFIDIDIDTDIDDAE